jgi:hypothetical protein
MKPVRTSPAGRPRPSGGRNPSSPRASVAEPPAAVFRTAVRKREQTPSRSQPRGQKRSGRGGSDCQSACVECINSQRLSRSSKKAGRNCRKLHRSRGTARKDWRRGSESNRPAPNRICNLHILRCLRSLRYPRNPAWKHKLAQNPHRERSFEITTPITVPTMRNAIFSM